MTSARNLILLGLFIQNGFLLASTLTGKFLICSPQKMGCADQIQIEKRNYLIDPKNDATNERVTSLLENYRAKKIPVSPDFQIEGKTVREKGHFPNPTEFFDVLKLENFTEKK